MYAMDGVESVSKSFIVAYVGDNHIVLRYFGKCSGVYKEGFQLFQTSAMLGGNEEFGGIHIGKGGA